MFAFVIVVVVVVVCNDRGCAESRVIQTFPSMDFNLLIMESSC
jgi:hypothetical protein